MECVVGISATPRRGGNSDRIMEAILAGAASRGVEVRPVRLRDYTVAPCTGCEACRKDKACTGVRDGFQLLAPLLEEARGLVIATPVHTYNVSAMLKAFIDRLYCYYDFGDDTPRSWSSRLAGQGRKAVLAAIAEQESRENLGVAMPAMRLPLASHDWEVVGELEVLGIFRAGAVRKRPEVMARAGELGGLLADSLAGQ